MGKTGACGPITAQTEAYGWEGAITQTAPRTRYQLQPAPQTHNADGSEGGPEMGRPPALDDLGLQSDSITVHYTVMEGTLDLAHLLRAPMEEGRCQVVPEVLAGLHSWSTFSPLHHERKS
jgi:hypothetical protein